MMARIELVLPVLSRLVKAFRAEWPRVSIIWREDAAFGSSELLNWCEDQGKEEPELTVHYITVMKRPDHVCLDKCSFKAPGHH